MSISGTWRALKYDVEGMKKFYQLLERPPEFIEKVPEFLSKIYYTTEDKGDSFTTTIHNTPDGDQVKTVKFNEEFEDEGRFGKVKTKLVREGNKIVSNETYANGKTSSTIRELNGDEMTVTMSTGGHTVVNVFKRD